MKPAQRPDRDRLLRAAAEAARAKRGLAAARPGRAASERQVRSAKQRLR